MNNVQNEQGGKREQGEPSENGKTQARPEPREATQSGAPERELELRLKKNPCDDSAKVDVGSDESMDASDPVSATAPGGNEPVPSSTFPEEK